MTETLQKHLDESIKLELSLAKLYSLFHDSFFEDEDFWWELTMEEQGHASLLQQEKKQPQPLEFFPDNLLSTDLQSLIALQVALDLELAAGESHFQQFLDSPTNSFSANIFKQLNQEDCDHAERIRSYMKENTENKRN